MNISGFSRKYNFRITIYKYLIFLLFFLYVYKLSIHKGATRVLAGASPLAMPCSLPELWG